LISGYAGEEHMTHRTVKNAAWLTLALYILVLMAVALPSYF